MFRHKFLAVLGFASLMGAVAASCQENGNYVEPFRPQVHFSPRKNWMNDPNGLVFFQGEYHLFYQYNPAADTWGHMSWGHAVSKDLLHWTELPVALPEHDGEMIFTGSVVVDEKNTSGLCKDGNPCLIAIYTSHRENGGHIQRETQSIASSQDGGRTWKFYSGNPVLDLNMSDFRDPSVTWNEQTNSWLMAVSLPDEHKVAFYSSPNLKQWTRLSTFGPVGATGGQWECPDLLKIPTRDGSSSVWALKVGLNPGALQGGSGEQYFLGNFDGREFHLLPGQANLWTDYGKDSYCAISFNHLPAQTPPTLIGWMNNWQYADKLPTHPWRGQMTLPRRVFATRENNSFALAQEPVIASLHTGSARTLNKRIPAHRKFVEIVSTKSPTEIKLTFVPHDAAQFGVRLYSDAEHWTEIGFDRARLVMYVDRTNAGLSVSDYFPTKTEAPATSSRPWNLDIVIDRSSVEVFAQDGTVAMTNLVFPPSPVIKAVVFHNGGIQHIDITGQVWHLKSIWPPLGR